MKRFLSFSVRDTLISLLIITLACLICVATSGMSDSEHHILLIFVLTVMLISRLTEGYFYGVVASFFSVFFVNYVFTYPFFAFNFTIAGYPLTFASMLGVSLVICTLTTRIKQQEEIRIESEAEKMRANLLRAISHDLRTPLTSIIGSIATVCENMAQLPQEKQLELLDEAGEDAKWLLRMVENLLSITRIDNDVTTLKKDLEAVEEVLAEAVGKVKKHRPSIPVHVSVPPSLFFVPMDAILIEQVIINLLYNAAIHSEHATEIRLAAVQQGTCALFSVEDNGVGFAQEILPHLFDQPYSPTKKHLYSDTRQNMGIGLSVCHSIILAHGGRMQAENRASGGAKITFALPMEDAKCNE